MCLCVSGLCLCVRLRVYLCTLNKVITAAFLFPEKERERERERETETETERETETETETEIVMERENTHYWKCIGVKYSPSRHQEVGEEEKPLYIHMYLHVYTHTHTCMHVYMYVCMYIAYICIYVYIYICTCTYIERDLTAV